MAEALPQQADRLLLGEEELGGNLGDGVLARSKALHSDARKGAGACNVTDKLLLRQSAREAGDECVMAFHCFRNMREV